MGHVKSHYLLERSARYVRKLATSPCSNFFVCFFNFVDFFLSFFAFQKENKKKKKNKNNQQTLGQMVSKIQQVWQWDNLDGRSNQQETEKISGSSETLRGIFFFSKPNKNSKNTSIASRYNFSEFLKLSRGQKNPKHFLSTQKGFEKQKFLEWFVGFSEGDASFGFQEGRLVFVINQAEIEILQKIRSELGFGVVSTFTQQGRVYARYCVKKKNGILCLIHLFNGNIHLQKVHDRFTRWVQNYNKFYNPTENEQIILQPRRSPREISFETAWLAGFFDAEGGFYAGITEENKETNRRFRLRLKAYVDQKNEFDVLQQIQSLFGLASVTIRNAEKNTYRVECSTKQSLEKILVYFEHHNLRSKKHIVYAMWKKVVYSYFTKSYLQNLDQLYKRVNRIQMQNKLFKEQKTCLPK